MFKWAATWQALGTWHSLGMIAPPFQALLPPKPLNPLAQRSPDAKEHNLMFGYNMNIDDLAP